MKPRNLAIIAAAVAGLAHLSAQDKGAAPPAGPTDVVEVGADVPPANPAPPAPGGEAPKMGEREDGYWLKDASLNEVLQFLAKKAGKQYFHNASMEGPQFKVTGHLNNGNPEQQMEELAFQFGIELYHKGETIYALNSTQVNQLPQEDFTYQLRYLRPTDIDQIKGIVQPMLTPGTGSVNFEPKTNTLLILDSAKRIATVKGLLEKLDQPKGQIIVETKILRVTSTAGSKIGVDWTSTLGDGITFDAQQSLNALFNLPESSTATTKLVNTAVSTVTGTSTKTSKKSGSSTSNSASDSSSSDSLGYTINNDLSIGYTGGSSSKSNSSGDDSSTGTSSTTNDSSSTSTSSKGSDYTNTIDTVRTQGAGLVLSPIGLQAVLKALNDGNLASQKSNPTIITEDNEQATVSIIDRVPIITATSTQQSGVNQITEEVRYRIDKEDSIEPDKTREIGVTVAVTPTVLPDNTVRMKLRPRTAQITEFIEGIPQGNTGVGNKYPRVAEATIDTIARVPNGYSLLIGGFYNEEKKDKETKVPILGDIPILNFFFKSKETSKAQTSLVFVITPTSYNPEGAVETLNVTDQLMDRLDIRADHDSINPNAPGAAHKANLRRSIRGMLFDAFGPKNAPQEEPLPTLPGYEALPPMTPPAAAVPERLPSGMKSSALRGPRLKNPSVPPAPVAEPKEPTPPPPPKPLPTLQSTPDSQAPTAPPPPPPGKPKAKPGEQAPTKLEPPPPPPGDETAAPPPRPASTPLFR